MTRTIARRDEAALSPPSEIRAWLAETHDIKAIRRMEGRVNKFAEMLHREVETRERAAEYMRLRNDIARRGGELLSATVTRGRPSANAATLAALLGVKTDAAAQHVSSRWQGVRSVPEDAYAKWQKRDEPYQAGLLKLAARLRKLKRDRRPVPGSPTLHNCSISELVEKLEADSVDIIVTDPPYPEEFLPVYSELGAFAAKVLKRGGLCLTMAGQSYLPDVIARLGAFVEYHWTVAYLTPGGQAVQQWDRRVNTFWKPVLVHSNGPHVGDWFGDVTRSAVNDNDKDFHNWGQSESGMADLMSRFVQEGQLVADPFLGGGTTAVIACAMGCDFVGCDSDPTAVETTRARFA